MILIPPGADASDHLTLEMRYRRGDDRYTVCATVVAGTDEGGTLRVEESLPIGPSVRSVSVHHEPFRVSPDAPRYRTREVVTVRYPRVFGGKFGWSHPYRFVDPTQADRAAWEDAGAVESAPFRWVVEVGTPEDVADPPVPSDGTDQGGTS